MQPTESQKHTKKVFIRLLAILFVIFLVCFCIFWFFCLQKYAITKEILGQFGDFIGGILNPTAAAFALFALWKTTQSQTEILEKQLVEEKERTTEERKRAESAQAETEKLRIHEAEKLHNEIFYRQFDAYLRTVDSLKLIDRQHEKGKMVFRLAGDYNRSNTTGGLPFYINININEYIKDTELESYDKDELNNFRTNMVNILNNDYNVKILYPYFRVIHNILKTQYDQYKKSDSTSQQSCIDNINFFRAQLTDYELAWIGLNLLTEKGEGMFPYAAHFALLKHLESKNIHSHLNNIHTEEKASKLFKENYA